MKAFVFFLLMTIATVASPFKIKTYVPESEFSLGDTLTLIVELERSDAKAYVLDRVEGEDLVKGLELVSKKTRQKKEVTQHGQKTLTELTYQYKMISLGKIDFTSLQLKALSAEGALPLKVTEWPKVEVLEKKDSNVPIGLLSLGGILGVVLGVFLRKKRKNEITEDWLESDFNKVKTSIGLLKTEDWIALLNEQLALQLKKSEKEFSLDWLNDLQREEKHWLELNALCKEAQFGKELKAYQQRELLKSILMDLEIEL